MPVLWKNRQAIGEYDAEQMDEQERNTKNRQSIRRFSVGFLSGNSAEFSDSNGIIPFDGRIHKK